MSADFGLVGLAVMGENLVLNIESRGFTVAVFNRTTSKVDEFVEGRGKGKKFVGCKSLEELCKNLKKPRKVMLMVKAGKPVDDFIEALVPHLEKGDIIIDGGNSYYRDSTRRTMSCEARGLHFIGAGVSGGEEGALKGPSIMPGGASAAWPHVKPIFQAIAAKVFDGSPCCEWVGPEGSGHYVKMVHNGIEYGDMQLIAEAYHLMSAGLGMKPAEIADVFDKWNKGPLDSYLIEITAALLKKNDEETGKPMVEVILDCAGQKGTGKWTAEAGLDLACGGGLCAVDLGRQRRARRGRQGPPRPGVPRQAGRPRSLHPEPPRRVVRFEALQLRAGLRAAAGRVGRVQVGPEVRRHCPHVARRLHHPRRLPEGHQGRVRQGAEAGEPAARALLYRRYPQGAGRLARRRRLRRRARHPAPLHVLRPVLLRFIPLRHPPRQRHPGAARLLRGAHLRAARQGPRPVLPHRLDRVRRQDDLERLLCLRGARGPAEVLGRIIALFVQ